MPTEADIHRIETAINYTFRKPHLAIEALTAAGADDHNHDGNRTLARYGRVFIELYALESAVDAGATQAINVESEGAKSRQRHADIAKREGFDAYIKSCPRQGNEPPSQTTLSLAICAIVGAVCLDSGKNFSVIYESIERLGIASKKQKCLPPSVLTHAEGAFPLQPKSDQGLSWGRFIDFPQSEEGLNNVVRPDKSHHDNLLESSSAEVLTPALWGDEDLSARMSTWILRQREFVHDTENDVLTVPHTFHPYASSATASEGDRTIEAAHTSQSEAPSPRSYGYNRNGIEQGLRAASANNDEPDARNDNEIREPSPSQMELNIICVQQRDHRKSNRRTSPVRQGPTKRRRIHHESTRPKESLEASVDEYIEEEREKCRHLGITYQEALYRTPGNQEWISSLTKDEDRAIVRALVAAVGGPESLATLRDVISECKERAGGQHVAPCQDLSPAYRLEIIERLEVEVAYLEFLKRWHVLRLFRDHCGNQYADGFVNDTPENIAKRTRRGPGNPKKLAESQTTLAMFGEIYPSLPQGTREYDRKYRHFTKLRRLGRRLSLLTRTFGDGVLGLLPSASYIPVAGMSVRTIDEMILSVPDETFDKLVRYLDQAQGGVLREFSNAVRNIVTSILNGDLSSSRTFPLEDVKQHDILSKPKGSRQLLKLVGDMAGGIQETQE